MKMYPHAGALSIPATSCLTATSASVARPPFESLTEQFSGRPLLVVRCCGKMILLLMILPFPYRQRIPIRSRPWLPPVPYGTLLQIVPESIPKQLPLMLTLIAMPLGLNVSNDTAPYFNLLTLHGPPHALNPID